jgi:hypothetical protein
MRTRAPTHGNNGTGGAERGGDELACSEAIVGPALRTTEAILNTRKPATEYTRFLRYVQQAPNTCLSPKEGVFPPESLLWHALRS